MKKIIGVLVFVGVVIALLFVLGPKSSDEVKEQLADSPKNSTYVIDGQSVTLKDGIETHEAALGSASVVTTRLFGEPVLGDVTGDGLLDAVSFLTQERGGSGSFFYAVAAIQSEGGFQGTNAILLGDRITPNTISIQDGLAAVNFADRKPSEPMTAKPSLGVTKYLLVKYGVLSEIQPLEVGESVFYGNLVMGHEARTFKSCAEKTDYWVMGDSPAYRDLTGAYNTNAATATDPYAPVYIVISGKIVPAPEDGFGADYKNAITVKELITVPKGGVCN
ncbi:MAG: hypothetical protein A2664_04760 [Candidatus Taylorbacteria bacterium RIFCSPHIGHO2_01_FULL_46_22b]|uniref:NlpE C-terminal OB domain-containing protein n=1 Tax=Candidatus Taylorbacteria bacterium RIFCSPHIGHO2_01_FULL_46_22b TaxID=1802301 RepID=A0A1G2M6P0_9BACT|nr:MAG: hypothetical protein A2664_04760 [Candidatus Taylorbacteria bacterium RIFCSPHIGHO2_01_FULL_46_22b]